MPDELELARGWFLKAESDLHTAQLPSWPLGGLDLTELSSYAVEARYVFEFWPDRQTGQEAVGLASEVRRLVLGVVPQGARP